MSELKSPISGSAKIADGPSLDDKPFVASGPPKPLPAGEAFKSDPNSVYRLKATWIDQSGNSATGYAYPMGQNATASFWDYVVFRALDGTGVLKFYLSPPDQDGYSRWNIVDDASNKGYHLDCKATGWLYRASLYNTKFQIVGDHLHCNYWDGPAGSTYRSVFVSAGEYLGMGNLPKFTCELELVAGEVARVA